MLKNKLSTLKDEQKDNDYNQKLIVEKINLQKQNIEENKKNHLVEINKKEKEVADNNAYLTKISKNIVLIQKHIEQLSNKINDELAVKKKSTKIQTLQSKFDDSIKKLNKEISFYETNDNCPTCHQNITVDTKDKNIKEKQTKITEITDAVIVTGKQIGRAHV